jgi:hypothetical protein
MGMIRSASGDAPLLRTSESLILTALRLGVIILSNWE